MFFIIFVGLLVSALAGAGLFLAMFFSVAFESQGVLGHGGLSALPARKRETSTLRRKLAQEGRFTVTRPAASDSVGEESHSPAYWHCPQVDRAEASRPMSVTPPEALAIADYLETHCTLEETANIRQAAQANAERTACTGVAECTWSCPLRAADGRCMVAPVRPAACHAAPCVDGATPVDEPPLEAGVRQGLRLAGLDAQAYELSSALAVVLADSSAATRWRDGENVFADCRVVA